MTDRKRHLAACEGAAHAVGIVADDPVHSEVEHRLDLRRFVHRPRNHPQAECTRLLQVGRVQVAVKRGPHGTPGCLDEARSLAVELVDVETGRPGRGAGSLAMEGVVFALLAGQTDGRDVGMVLRDMAQAAKVEGLDQRSVLDTRRSNLGDQGLGELDRIHGPAGLLGIQLRLDVVEDGASANALGLGEHVGQPRDAGAVSALLQREARGIAATRLQSPHVVLQDLLRSELADPRSRELDPSAVPAARDGRIQSLVVVDDRDPVPGDADVHLERRDADRERRAKAGKGVLRVQTARPAVPLEIEVGRRNHGCGGAPACDAEQ